MDRLARPAYPLLGWEVAIPSSIDTSARTPVIPMSDPSAVPNGIYDEMYDAHGHPRRKTFAEKLKGLTFEDLRQRQNRAESTLLTRGITFAVYGDQAGNEKIWPFDVIPRIIDGPEWQMIENGP